MIPVAFQSLGVWPGVFTDPRLGAPFNSAWSDTLTLLDRELAQLGARQVVAQLALPKSKIRRDGWPLADARPEHPGVILSFESDRGPLTFATDLYYVGRFRSG